MRKQFLCLMLISVGMFLCSCGRDERYDYDKGYEAAWNEEEPDRFSSKKFGAGYQQGLEDAAAYNDGYYDGYNKKKAQYPRDPDYMDGFKDGFKDKKY